MKASKIDVHHHIFPSQYVKELNQMGVEKSFGVDFPAWKVDTSLKKMEANGIKMAILSISTPGVYFKGQDFPEGFSENLARLTNEILADTRNKFPEKFGGFATIPMLDQQAAVSELQYAMDTLKLDGVCLLSNYKGRYLGDPWFDPFFRELNKRKTVVFVHPTDPGDDFDFRLNMPNALIEAPFDTTRAVTNMMFNGIFNRYPDIRYILAHGGGTIPYLAWRLASIEYAQNGKRTPLLRTFYDFLVNGGPTKGLRHLKKLYYDTAHVSGEYALKALQTFAGPDHLVFGTDLCISRLAPIVTKNLDKNGDFTEETYRKLSHENCLKLFPSFKKVFQV